MDFNSLWQIIITFFVAFLAAVISVLTFFEKAEKLLARIYKFFGFISESYVRRDLQGKINDYLKKVSKKVKHLDIKKIKIKWVDAKNQTEKEYTQDGEMVIRLKRGDHQNENIVRASMAFISHAFLKKAKLHIAKYQRDSLDLYACYDLLKSEEKQELSDQFVQDFMKEKMDDEKVSGFFEKCSDIDDVGIFYPVLVQELTFLGERFLQKNEMHKKFMKK